MSTVLLYQNFTADEEQSGPIDKSGNSNNGTLDNASIELLPSIGRVIAFPEGTPSVWPMKVDIPNSGTLGINGPFSVNVRFNKYTDPAAMLFDKDLSFRLWFPDGTMRPTLSIYDGSSWHSFVSSTVLGVEKDYFLTASFDGSVVRLFCNGVTIHEEAYSGAVNNSISILTIGNYYYGFFQFEGHISLAELRDSPMTLQDHKDAAIAGREMASHSIIELLDISKAGVDFHFTTYKEKINVTVPA